MKQNGFSEILLWIGVVVLTALVWLFLRDKPQFMETPKEVVDVSVPVSIAKDESQLGKEFFDHLDFDIMLDSLELPDFPETVKNGELILGFGDATGLKQFSDAAKAQGVRILGKVPALGLARVSTRNLRGLAELGAEFGEGMETGLNHWVRAPAPAVPLDHSEVRGFGSEALGWLGVPESNSNWGKGVKIAILDSGVWTEHSTFSGANIQQIDMLDPEQSVPGEYDGHGTAVASLIVGNSNQQRGISPAAELISVRVLDGEGRGDSFTLAEGIVAAVDQGAKVLSLSLGSGGEGIVLRKAVDYALKKGAVMVASAGNDGLSQVTYPAAYSDVIGVSAVDAAGKLADFSNIGEGVDLAAPGIGLHSAWLDDGEVSFSGTSASAPLVAGAVAGILSQEPRMSANDVANLLSEYADDGYAAGKDPRVGHGVLNLERVLERNQRGVYDVAVGGFHFSPLSSHSSNKGFEISIQNRGTEWVSGATLDLNIEGRSKRFFMGSMKPGEVLTTEWFLTPEQILDKSGTSLKARVALNGRQDIRPENDQWNSVIVLPD